MSWFTFGGHSRSTIFSKGEDLFQLPSPIRAATQQRPLRQSASSDISHSPHLVLYGRSGDRQLVVSEELEHLNQLATGATTLPVTRRTSQPSRPSSQLTPLVDSQSSSATFTSSYTLPTMAPSQKAVVPEVRARSCIACGECEDTTKALVKACRLCNCDYCNDCLTDMFEAAIDDPSRMPPRCCALIQLHTAIPYLNATQAQHYRRKFEEWLAVNKLYCPSAPCSAFISDVHLPKHRLPTDDSEHYLPVNARSRVGLQYVLCNQRTDH